MMLGADEIKGRIVQLENYLNAALQYEEYRNHSTMVLAHLCTQACTFSSNKGFSISAGVPGSERVLLCERVDQGQRRDGEEAGRGRRNQQNPPQIL